MKKLWDQNEEKNFFLSCLKIAKPEQLFYLTRDHKYLAYWPKNYNAPRTTLQSRNSFIGSYTEKWATKLFNQIARTINAYAVPGVICREIGLSKESPADLAICKTKDILQEPKNILLIVEVKMSLVWNWEFKPDTKEVVCIGDYKTHQGNPSLLRSDTMLKAIGKSINIRVSSVAASTVPIIVIGNTPISKSYYTKVDNLKASGIIQGFWSVNSNPAVNDSGNIKCTPLGGFYRIDEYKELEQSIVKLLNEDSEFFCGMQAPRKLGEIIEIASKEVTYEAKAHKFLKLLRQAEGWL